MTAFRISPITLRITNTLFPLIFYGKYLILKNPDVEIWAQMEYFSGRGWGKPEKMLTDLHLSRIRIL
jgi:hypothetical protein